uniref:Innexin n=1 Tax=Caligus clemensi TaxID=344056 RepID=C1C3B1_CALCM|nr:Innexin shaking-B [Caligus clemensi]
MSVVAISREFFSFLRKKQDSERVSVSSTVLNLMKVTSMILFACSVLSTAKQFFGDPIHCDTGSVNVDSELFEHYCWIQASFVAPQRFSNASSLRYNHKEDERIYQNYYQWIPFILFFQGVLCYFPYNYWKLSESGKVAELLKILKTDQESPNNTGSLYYRGSAFLNIGSLAKSLVLKRGSHCAYALKYLLAQFLCVASLAIQLYAMDFLMGGNFLTMGTKLLYIQTDEDIKDFDKNPLLKIFPRLIRCWFESKIGMSGTPERYPALCILPVNVFNEKVFVFMWFWFIILLTTGLFYLLWTVITVACSLPRIFILRFSVSSSNSSYAFDRLVQMSDFGDWFLLRLIRRNIDSTTFTMLMDDLAEQMTTRAFQNFEYPTISPLSRKASRREDSSDAASLSGRISRV